MLLYAADKIASPTNPAYWTRNRPGNNRTQAPWQEDVVSAYQRSASSGSSKLYTATGRGLPDVAAYDAGYNIIQNGENKQVDGTSAACPVWAGIVALLNDQRHPTIGLV